MNTNKSVEYQSLPPPPQMSPASFVLMKEKLEKVYFPMARRGIGSKGQKIQLLTNHFRVGISSRKDGYFYHYDVSLSYEDGHPVKSKDISRKVMDKAYGTYDELKRMEFAYDGEKSLFTTNSLQCNKQEFIVVLEEVSSKRVGRNGSTDGLNGGSCKRTRLQSQSKTFKIIISYVTKIPIQAIANALHDQDSEHFQEGLRVLDIILRHHAAKQGCLIVRQSFFQGKPSNYADLGGGVLGCRGFHSSFRATKGGLCLNIDVATTMIVKPCRVLDFLCENQSVKHPKLIDWAKAKSMLKKFRIKVNNMEHTITGLSDKPCRTQTFLLRHGKGANGEVQSSEITVYDYFKHFKKIELHYSANLPCIDVGKSNDPSYFPVELCTLVSLQRYTKALSNLQKAQLVEKSRQKPCERKAILIDFLRNSGYDKEPMLCSSGITIESDFTKVDGRVLQPPKLKAGNGEDIIPRNGRWNFNNKKLVQPVKIERWAIVNFSAQCDIRFLVELIMKCAKMKGITIMLPFYPAFEEDKRFAGEPAPVRVEKMYEMIRTKMPQRPQLILCILPKSKNSEIYGYWKRKNLVEVGVATQCIAPTKVNDQYITNVLFKINAKLGGVNSFLSMESSRSIPLVSSEPTLILGMDVSHASAGQSDVPSIAAVVSSRYYPLISRYKAVVRAQPPKVEIIESLFKPVSDTTDEGIIREVLIDFEKTSGGRKPRHIIILRDGVSESQFNHVMNKEMNQIIKACNHYDKNWSPKFTFIVAQKNHHTKFFQANAPENVPPGTVIDNKICHPKNNDFYMCTHAGMIGTTRPTHYIVLHDEIGFSADQLQDLVHCLCYVGQRSTNALSLVAPIYYADLAAYQMLQIMKFDELSKTSSGQGGLTSAGEPEVPQLLRLHEYVANSMFFC